MVEKFIAQRMGQLPTYAIQQMMSLASDMERRGEKLIHLEIGEPDYDTPAHIAEAAYKAIRDGYTRYTTAMGLAELREALAERIKADYSLEVDPRSEIIVTPGSKQAIYCAIVATVNAGEEVIVPSPFFPAYEFAIALVGAKLMEVPLREELDFALDTEELERAVTPRTKMILLNFPHNPTGSTLTKEAANAIAEIAERYDLLVLSDEVYDKFTYADGGHISIVTLPGMKQRTIVANSFSKTYSMTGWRLGYAFAPKSIIDGIRKVQEASTTCAAAFTQIAGVHALKSLQDSVEEMRREFDRRRVLLVEGLNQIKGISCRLPKGAFFAFPNISALGQPSAQVAEYLLKEAKVVTVAGSGFGSYGEGYLRLSYANSAENIERALAQMKESIEGKIKV